MASPRRSRASRNPRLPLTREQYGTAPPTADFGPIFPGSPAGWISNWYNALTVSGSGMEGMGAGDVHAAAGAIAAFLAAQDVYKASPSAARDVAAVLTQSWLMHQFSGNSVSVTLNGGTRQFVRLADGSWIAPRAGRRYLSAGPASDLAATPPAVAIRISRCASRAASRRSV
jgi:hypothetical protein